METEPPGTGSSEMSSLVDDGLLEASDVVGGIALVLVVGEYDLVVVVAAVVGVVPSVGEVSKSGLLVSEGPIHEEEEEEGRGIQRRRGGGIQRRRGGGIQRRRGGWIQRKRGGGCSHC